MTPVEKKLQLNLELLSNPSSWSPRTAWLGQGKRQTPALGHLKCPADHSWKTGDGRSKLGQTTRPGRMGASDGAGALRGGVKGGEMGER